MLAATLLPGSSEALLVGLVAAYPAAASTLFAVATFGNTLGAMINWSFGRWLSRYSQSTWFPVKPDQLSRAKALFHKYGIWSLLFSWVPIVGDPLTFAAGVLRVPFLPFVLLVGVGKAARYLVVLGALRIGQELIK